uniref:Secreted protein n=1 Tax=Rhipicephalus appendiculatus TaxID=34631 RepID=A0A131YCW2_RHIAP
MVGGECWRYNFALFLLVFRRLSSKDSLLKCFMALAEAYCHFNMTLIARNFLSQQLQEGAVVYVMSVQVMLHFGLCRGQNSQL